MKHICFQSMKTMRAQIKPRTQWVTHKCASEWNRNHQWKNKPEKLFQLRIFRSKNCWSVQTSTELCKNFSKWVNLKTYWVSRLRFKHMFHISNELKRQNTGISSSFTTKFHYLRSLTTMYLMKSRYMLINTNAAETVAVALKFQLIPK